MHSNVSRQNILTFNNYSNSFDIFLFQIKSNTQKNSGIELLNE